MNKKESQSNLEEITKRLQSFLIEKQAENLVLTGAWGTGKTEAWKRVVKPLQRESAQYQHILIYLFFAVILAYSLRFFDIKYFFLRFLFFACYLILSGIFLSLLWKRKPIFARSKYTYVSAADCGTIKDLEEKILDAIQPSWQSGKAISLWNMLSREIFSPAMSTAVVLFYLFLPLMLLCSGKIISDLLNNENSWIVQHPCVITPFLTAIFSVFAVFFIFFKSNRKIVVFSNFTLCIDDIERASKKLEPQEILNFAADLRDNKNCKVALILNPDQFYEEKEKSSKDGENSNFQGTKREIWQNALEKGSDAHLELILDPKDAAKLAFSDKDGKEIQDKEDPLVKALRPHVIKLGINNVRIIQRIWKDLKRWKKLVEKVAKKEAVLESELYDRLSKYTSLFGMYYYQFKDTKYSDLEILPFFYNTQNTSEEKRKCSSEVWNPLISKGFLPQDFLDQGKNDWSDLAKIILENIKKGYLPENSFVEDDLSQYAFQLTSSHIAELVQKPWDLAQKELDPGSAIKEALFAIPLDLKKINHIGLKDATILLYLAGKLNEDNQVKKWEENFRNLYIESLKSRKLSFFEGEFPSPPNGICIDSKLKSKFDDFSKQKIKDSKIKKENGLLDRMFFIMRRGSAMELDNKHNYEDWNEFLIREKIKQFTPQDICNLAHSFCYKIVPLNVAPHPGFPEIPPYFSYMAEKKFCKDWPGFLAFQKLGNLLYPVLKEYWDSKKIMNPALEEALTAYPWQKLINFEIPSAEEIKKQAENSPENINE